MSDYVVQDRTPSVEEYRRLRVLAGLTPRSAKASEAGLPNTFVGVVVEHDGKPIGMGRVIGDGALLFQLVDMAVDREHQGKGVGRRIMAALMEQLARRVPAEAYVSLIADGERTACTHSSASSLPRRRRSAWRCGCVEVRLRSARCPSGYTRRCPHRAASEPPASRECGGQAIG